MQDSELITIAKTEYREGYNASDPDRVLSVFAPAFTDMSAGQPSFYGSESCVALHSRLMVLFSHYSVRMGLAIANVQIIGDHAFDYGWQKLWLTPRGGGDEIFVRMRYVERWAKQSDGSWKIVFIMTNQDVKPEMSPYPETDILKGLAAAF